ncbi:MAG: gliding motility-associated protein GldE [Saprospiraceae bacterium]|nr:gliding motility-associated protein GldE [Saprospiraceae bacterium]
MESEPPLSYVFEIFNFIPLFIVADVGYVIALILLLMFSGIFAGSEVALFSLTSFDMDEIQEENTSTSRALVFFKDHPKRLLALLLVGNTFVNIGIAIIVERLLANYISKEILQSWANGLIDTFNLNPEYATSLATFFYFFIAVIGATSLILLFGEVTPKIYAQINARKFANWIAVPLRLLDVLFSPMTKLMVSMTNRVERQLLTKRVGMAMHSKEDLDAAIDLAVSNDNESDKQLKMLKGIIKFNDVTTKQVMTPRTAVYSIEFNDTYSEVIKTVKECGFSRIPVYNNNFDHMTGILYVKDLIAHLQETDKFEWQSLIRTDLHYVPESKKINEVLDDLQEKHIHLAFVVDEYGGINGIVTLEDIMEEIVGEITDEFDDHQELNYTRLDSHTYLFDAKTLINDMCRVLGLDVYSFDELRGNADSIAGLILEKTGEMPKKDQECEIGGLKIKTVAVSKKRIEQVKVTLI